MAVAVRPSGVSSQMLILSYGWCRDDEPADVLFELEGCDLSRGILPHIGHDALPPGDPFGEIFASVRDLVYDWPEVLPRAG